MKNTKFYLSKLIAIAIVVLGFHFMGAYMSQELPFRIVSKSIVLYGVWGYTGWAMALIAIVGGAFLFFLEVIDYLIHKYL